MGRMKRSVVIKRGLLLLAVCLAAWQLPTIIEQALVVQERFRSGVAAGEPGASLPTPPPKRAGERKMVVISPSGERLSPDEREKLRKAAEAAAPMRVGRARIDDPPELSDPTSQLDEMLKDAVERMPEGPARDQK